MLNGQTYERKGELLDSLENAMTDSVKAIDHAPRRREALL